MTPKEARAAQRMLHRIAEDIGDHFDPFDRHDLNRKGGLSDAVGALLHGVHAQFGDVKGRTDFVAVCMAASAAFVHLAAMAGGDVDADGKATAIDPELS